MYTDYVNNYPHALQLLQKVRTRARARGFARSRGLSQMRAGSDLRSRKRYASVLAYFDQAWPRALVRARGPTAGVRRPRHFPRRAVCPSRAC